MKKFLLFSAASLLLLASCSNSEDDMAASQSGTIEFRSVVDKTRASLIGSTAELESFFVKGLQGATYLDYLSASVYLDGSTWTYSPKKYWPVNDDVVYFYAFAPYSNEIKSSMVTNGSSVEFDYTVPADQSIQNTAVDLLVANASGKGSTHSLTAVAFTFNHALSAATFSAENKNAAGSELVYTISKIEITGLDNEGVYNYASGWTPETNSNITYIAGVPASGVAVQPSAGSVKLLSANDIMMVLPQTPAATAKVKITYSLKDGEGASIYNNATKELALPNSFEFEAGTRYNFAFEFAASNAIQLTVTAVDNWTVVADTAIN